MFNFARANMIRAFGSDGWWEAWLTINAARLKSWGFNTIGVGVNNYEDENAAEYLEKAQIPFVYTLKKFPRTNVRIFRDFPDVYSKAFAEQAQDFARSQLGGLVGNPYLIGYFVNNEPEWKVPYINLAERVFAHPERLDSKAALIGWLKEEYGNIEAVNARWGRSFKSFEDMYLPIERLDAGTEEAGEDFAKLHALLVEKYITVLKAALSSVDPEHLNLGMRYAGAGPREMAGGEHQDVFSFNHYSPSAAEALEAAGAYMDVPVIIGEWHIGGEKSMLAHGIWFSHTQEERAKACEFYMQGAMANRNCVGIHYFEMNDQPLLGRFDGENMAHGAIDVCNRPYKELIEHFKSTAAKMYELCDGQAPPTETTGEAIRRK
ncbi:beta-galactosidase [Acutalibacter muris]